MTRRKFGKRLNITVIFQLDQYQYIEYRQKILPISNTDHYLLCFEVQWLLLFLFTSASTAVTPINYYWFFLNMFSRKHLLNGLSSLPICFPIQEQLRSGTAEGRGRNFCSGTRFAQFKPAINKFVLSHAIIQC